MLLSFAVSEAALDEYAKLKAKGGEEEEERCDWKNSAAVVDKINAQRRLAQDDRIIPPIARRQVLESEENIAIEMAREEKRLIWVDSPILSKEVVGGAVCLLTNMISSNARQLVIGQVLLTNGWNVFRFGWDAPLLFFMGLLVFGLFFFMNLYIAFYILDAMIDVLLLAFKWPFMVVGYAFDVAKFKLSALTDIAIKFGSTVITLAMFTMFNALLISGFMFTVGGEKKYSQDILNDAISKGDVNVILEAFKGDVVGMSQFLFIVFAIFFTYANLSKFAEQFGAQVSDGHLRKVIKTTVTSAANLVFRGVRPKTGKDGKPEATYVKRPGKKKQGEAS
jgi:hypothetical protein